MLPYRNIRDILGLHAKVSPKKAALICYDENGQRESLSYLELVGKSHQIANLLYEDLGVKRGDCIAYLGANHENLLLLHFAAWVLGASLVSMDSHAFTQSNAQFAFVLHDKLAEAQAKRIPSIEGIIQIGGEAQENTLLLEEIAAHRPTTFLGDESGAKGADIPVIEGNERSATLGDCALFETSLSQEDLILAAQSYAQAFALTGNQSVVCASPFSDTSAFISSLIAPIFLGGTAVMMHHFEPALFWRTVVKEHASTTTLTNQQITELLNYAESNQTAGETIFGQKITQRDARHFRHILCLDKSLESSVANSFETRFGLPIQRGYAPNARLIASLPISLSWQQHQKWLHGDSQPTIGMAFPPYHLAVLDESGAELPAGETGRLAFRISHQNNWQLTKDTAYLRLASDNQTYYFLLS